MDCPFNKRQRQYVLKLLVRMIKTCSIEKNVNYVVKFPIFFTADDCILKLGSSLLIKVKYILQINFINFTNVQAGVPPPPAAHFLKMVVAFIHFKGTFAHDYGP